jgi:hypothetical protein
VSAADLVPDRGYWIRLAQSDSVVLTTVSPPRTVSLQPGWNLIGNSTAVRLNFPTGSGWTSPYAFRDGRYVSTNVLEPGEGAWVRAQVAAEVPLQETSDGVRILAAQYSLDGGATWSTQDPVDVAAGTRIWFRLQLGDASGVPLASAGVSAHRPRRQHDSPGSPMVLMPDSTTTDSQGWVYWTNPETDLSDRVAGNVRNVFMFLDRSGNSLYDAGELRSPADDFTFNFVSATS